MSAGEIFLRAVRAVGQTWEQGRLSRGWAPGAGIELVQTLPLFPPDERVLDEWRRRFTLDVGLLERLLAGEVTFFGETYRVGPVPDWHRDPATGRRAPLTYGKTINYRDESVAGNIKTLWELNRHQHLVPLAVGYALTGDARYKSAVVRQIESWIDANPYGFGVHWCSSLEVALRAIAWCMVHSLIAIRDGAGGLVAAANRSGSVAQSLYQHGYFIQNLLSRYSSANNHLIGELVGLWCLSRVCDFGPPSTQWAALAKQELEQEVVRQVHADGVAKEQAVHYQLEVMEYYLFAWCVGRTSGADLAPVVLQRLFGMVEFMRAVTPDAGQPPQIGDSDEGTVNRFRAGPLDHVDDELMDAIEQVFGARAVWGGKYEKGFWYRQMAVRQGPENVAMPAFQQEAVKLFPEGGYAVLQRDGVHVVFDAGPLGYPSIAAHGHADALSFCLAWQGRWWLVDPGTYSYHGEPAYRNYFRGTNAHNTVTVGDQDQSQPGGAFLWVRHAEAALVGGGRDEGGILWAEGYHDGYRPLGIRHRRRIELEAGRLNVTDLFEPSTVREVPASLHFHFAPQLEVELSATCCRATLPVAGETNPRCLTIHLDQQCAWQLVRGAEDPILGWYSTGLGKKEPCWTLIGRLSISPQTQNVSTSLTFE